MSNSSNKLLVVIIALFFLCIIIGLTFCDSIKQHLFIFRNECGPLLEVIVLVIAVYTIIINISYAGAAKTSKLFYSLALRIKHTKIYSHFLITQLNKKIKRYEYVKYLRHNPFMFLVLTGVCIIHLMFALFVCILGILFLHIQFSHDPSFFVKGQAILGQNILFSITAYLFIKTCKLFINTYNFKSYYKYILLYKDYVFLHVDQKRLSQKERKIINTLLTLDKNSPLLKKVPTSCLIFIKNLEKNEEKILSKIDNKLKAKNKTQKFK